MTDQLATPSQTPKAKRVEKLLSEANALYQKKTAGYGDAIIISAKIMELLLSNVPDERLCELRKHLPYLELEGEMYRTLDKFIRMFNILGNGDLDNLGESFVDTGRDIIPYAGMIADTLQQLEEVVTYIQPGSVIRVKGPNEGNPHNQEQIDRALNER